MAVLSLKILDRHQNIQHAEQTEETHEYPVLVSGCIPNIRSQKIIERWVDIIQQRARR